MKYNLILGTFLMLMLPFITQAQNDSTAAKKDSAIVKKDSTTASIKDSMAKPAADTTAFVVKSDSAALATPMNCYKQWFDYFTELGAKPVTDGMQLVVIAFKSKESCHCYMGRVEVSGGKIKSPVFVQTEGGDYKPITSLGKKLDPEFVSTQGDGLWQIGNGMSVVFQTTDQEYGRLFFYKFLNKNKQMNKEAPSPSDLLKN